ncbi:MAG TPA: TIGR02206 family membrane protein [Bacillota bacterium]|nr:TIGR02206 family membrane protein [Bacillota bacterium]
MSFFQHFFAGVERSEPVDIPPFLVTALLIFWIGVMVLIMTFRQQLSSRKNPMFLARIAAVILLVDQIVLYSWQIFSGYFNIRFSLPLYHCRIAVPLLILDLVFGVKILRSIWIYWGFIGSVFSMLFLDLYRFDFPHYTNFQFFIVHLLLGWLVFYAIFALGYKFEKKGLQLALIVTTLFNLALILFNAALNHSFIAHEDSLYNYGYMLFPPGPLKEIALAFPPFVFNLVMLIGYNLLILLLYSGGYALNKISYRSKKRKTEAVKA